MVVGENLFKGHQQALSHYDGTINYQMKTSTILLTLLLFLTFKEIYGQTINKLTFKIDSLYAKDQSVQLEIQNALDNKVPFDSIQKLQDAMKKLFDRHIPIIKQIIDKSGYPTIRKVGEQASHNFFTLIQHSDADPAFQASLLPLFLNLSNNGEISKKDYAFLYDRVQRNTGKKQLYGTQLSFDNNGNLFDISNKIITPLDLADPEKVDKRRKGMGLEPLEQYYESVLTTFGRPRKK